MNVQSEKTAQYLNGIFAFSFVERLACAAKAVAFYYYCFYRFTLFGGGLTH